MADINTYFNKTRVETFSDGIFAVIITLLVLEIKVPEIHEHHSARELATALWPLLPKMISWMVSFFIVCVIWVSHHQLMEQLRVITHGLFWLNALLLMWCALIPFPTALLGDYATNPMAGLVFGILLSMMGFAFWAIRLYILRWPHVLKESPGREANRRVAVRTFIFGPMLYLVGGVSALVHPYIALTIFAFIPVYFIFFFNPVR